MNRKTLVLSIVFLAVIFAACSSGPKTEFSVSAQEFAFSPGSWTVAADTDVKINFSNKGSVDHEWAVLTAGTNITTEDQFNEEIVLWEVEAIAAGTSVTETFNFPAGTYQVICAVETHLNAGMIGTLTVEAAEG